MSGARYRLWIGGDGRLSRRHAAASRSSFKTAKPCELCLKAVGARLYDPTVRMWQWPKPDDIGASSLNRLSVIATLKEAGADCPSDETINRYVSCEGAVRVCHQCHRLIVGGQYSYCPQCKKFTMSLVCDCGNEDLETWEEWP